MAFTKIDRTGKGVTGLPDTPTLSTNDMQEKFDELGVLAVDGVNNLIDELEADGAASMGVYAPPGYTDTELQPLLDNIATDVTANKAAKHTHPNKSLLDTLTQSIFDTLNRIATIFINITSVSPTVSDSNQVLPTGHAIVNYVSRMGGGDMLRSTYDQNEDGTIDVTAGGTGATSAADARTNLGLGSAATKASETTLSSSTSKVPTSSAVKTVTDGLGTRVTAAETNISNITSGYMAKSVYDTNNNGVVDTSENVRLNGRTDSIRFGIDSATGEYGYYKVGADSVTPFKTGFKSGEALLVAINSEGAQFYWSYSGSYFTNGFMHFDNLDFSNVKSFVFEISSPVTPVGAVDIRDSGGTLITSAVSGTCNVNGRTGVSIRARATNQTGGAPTRKLRFLSYVDMNDVVHNL